MNNRSGDKMQCRIVEEYHTASYNKFKENNIVQKDIVMSRVYKKMNNFSYRYLICEEEENCLGVFPFILYDNDIAKIINSMPFLGYGGISVDEIQKEEIFKCMIDYITDYAKNNDVTLITICTEPFDKNCDLYDKYFKADYKSKNFFQYIDLKNDIFQNMKSKFRGNLKRNIKKCSERYGIKIIESYELNDLKYWYENVYVNRLKETGCSIYPYEVFKTIIENIEKKRIKMYYGISEGKIIGGALYLNQLNSIDNYMRVVSTKYLHTQLGTYLDYLSIKYAIENDVKYYNWQSCDQIGSSIFKYKEDWGSKVGYHYYLTKAIKDTETLKKIPREKIRENFKGIYVLPYEEFMQEN
ncbi:hypothetical protein [Clostridium butyricum]|uniref:BioF2-like acetyltransferase domain-containing protein n=2 Tax=Clostridium butyricum TaxID=1492 RepID=C4IDN1_CLOBU|nr:hypothetical protein [Clostridium butyricum]EEP55325.1 hypothetical protein CLP_3461 [Clostridium butyricum E4 str. BoNT E BL5262]APF23413.1 hypothetical protein NPD4_3116 [Clostridium butyricum]EDT75260.1 hypothetical protein CBY_3601 [Clostridium butyricum 5521]NFL31539.1 GNAT family N-acetyltransferase [Clostridium butyricum]NFS18193.1 GNAT family N-acetyltransferase [Clostridium butyricum]